MPPKRKVATKSTKPDVSDGPSPPKATKVQKPEIVEEAPVKEDKPKRGAKKESKPEEPTVDAKPKGRPAKKSKAEEKSNKNDESVLKVERPKRGAKKDLPLTEGMNGDVIENVTKRGERSKYKSVSDVPQDQDDKPIKKKAAAKAKDTEKKPAAKTTKTAKKKEETASKSKAKKETNGDVKDPVKLLNDSVTKWESIDFSCDKKNAKGETYNLKITSWNVAGVRAWMKKDGLNIFKYDSPDILCLQELQCSEDKLPEELKEIEGYKSYRVASEQEGYAGVAVYSKTMPIDVQYGIKDEQFDDEGRCITLEYEKFFLVNVYVPNAGRGLKTLDKRLEWNDTFKQYIKSLDKKKPVILCGDMNVAHEEIDLANPKSNKKNAGFTPEEREGMTQFLKDGYIDTFREFYPDKIGAYTFWSYMGKARTKNVGWRLDYFIVSSQIIKNVCDSVIRDQVLGSDHCPLSLFLHI